MINLYAKAINVVKYILYITKHSVKNAELNLSDVKTITLVFLVLIRTNVYSSSNIRDFCIYKQDSYLFP